MTKKTMEASSENYSSTYSGGGGEDIRRCSLGTSILDSLLFSTSATAGVNCTLGRRPSLSLSFPMPAKERRGRKDFDASDFDLIGGEKGEVSRSALSGGGETDLLLGLGGSVGDGDRGISALNRRVDVMGKRSAHSSGVELATIELSSRGGARGGWVRKLVSQEL